MRSTIRRLWVSGPHQPDADSDNLDKNYLSSQTLTSQGLIFNFSISQVDQSFNTQTAVIMIIQILKALMVLPGTDSSIIAPVTFGAIHFITYNENEARLSSAYPRIQKCFARPTPPQNEICFLELNRKSICIFPRLIHNSTLWWYTWSNYNTHVTL